MKIYAIGAWISAALAVAIIVFGIIALLSGNNPFGIRHEVNYFHVASSLLLLAILCVLAQQGCKSRKE